MTPEQRTKVPISAFWLEKDKTKKASEGMLVKCEDEERKKETKKKRQKLVQQCVRTARHRGGWQEKKVGKKREKRERRGREGARKERET